VGQRHWLRMATFFGWPLLLPVRTRCSAKNT
jgi:hypothetical protein